MSAPDPSGPAAQAATARAAARRAAYHAAAARVVETHTAYREADDAWFFALYLAYGDAALERQNDACPAHHPSEVRELADARTLAFAEAATTMAQATMDTDAYLRWAWTRFLAGQR